MLFIPMNLLLIIIFLVISANDLSKSTLSNSGSTTQQTSDSTEEECFPPGLIKWRNAVENCRTAAQLAMCLNFLESHTAWDKSIMRAVSLHLSPFLLIFSILIGLFRI